MFDLTNHFNFFWSIKSPSSSSSEILNFSDSNSGGATSSIILRTSRADGLFMGLANVHFLTISRSWKTYRQIKSGQVWNCVVLFLMRFIWALYRSGERVHVIPWVNVWRHYDQGWQEDVNRLLELLLINRFIIDKLYAFNSCFICNNCLYFVLTVRSIVKQVLRNKIIKHNIKKN